VYSFFCEDDTVQCSILLRHGRLHWINTLYVKNLRKYFIFIQNTVKLHSPLSQVFPKEDHVPSRLKLHFQVGVERTGEINNGDIKYVNIHTFASTVKHLLLKSSYNKGTF